MIADDLRPWVSIGVRALRILRSRASAGIPAPRSLTDAKTSIFNEHAPMATTTYQARGGGVAGGNILAGLSPKPTSNGLREQSVRAMIERDNRQFDRGSKRLRQEVKSVLGIMVDPYQVIHRDGRPIVVIDGLSFRLHDPGSYKYLQVEWSAKGRTGKEWFGFNNLAELAEVIEDKRKYRGDDE